MINLKKTQIQLVLFLVLYGPITGISQNKKGIEKSVAVNKIMNIQFHYTYEFPGGDLASRFGNIHSIGSGGIFKTKKNWLYAFDASYQFNNDVKENIIYNLTNSSLTISNSSGTPGLVNVGQRGLAIFGKAGKLLPLSQENKNSGIVIMAGGGFYSHKINISTPQNNIPTLTDDLKKGYDRLTMGFAFTEFIGYQFQGRNRRINFYLGVDLIQAFTKSARGFNYDQMAYDDKSRLDYLLGPRIGWMIPIYMTTKEQDEFYYK